MTTETPADLAERLARTVVEHDFSGIVRITTPGGVAVEVCHGLADRAAGTAVHPGTRFATASMSKIVTALTVLDCARRGELAVTDRVVDVLPADRRPSTLREDVTVHHLLTHTSGIADYAEEDEGLPGYVEDYAALWQDLPCYRMRSDADLLPLFADREPYGPPGEEYRYSNAGYVLLGLVVEQASGLAFTDAATTRVLRPAGAVDSGYLAADEPHPDVATGYLAPSEEGGPWRSNVFSVPVVGGGDGGGLLTAADTDRLLRAIADGELGEDVLTRHADMGDGWSAGYGVEIRPDGVWGKDGGDPGVSTVCRFFPSNGTTVVMLANTEDTEEVWDVAADTAQAFAQA